MAELQWQPAAGEVAARVSASKLSGWRDADLLVELGTQAVLLAEGAVKDVVGPGTYPLSSLLQRVGRGLGGAWHTLDAVRIVTRPLPLYFSIPDLFTREPDPVSVAVTLTLAVQVVEPIRFLRVLMANRTSLVNQDLSAYLEGAVRLATTEWIEARSFDELKTYASVLPQYEAALEFGLEKMLIRAGLEWVGLDEVMTSQPDMVALRKRKAAFTERKRTDEQELAEVEYDVQHRERLRQVLSRAELGEAESQLDLAASLLEIKRRRLLTQDALDALERAQRERKEDAQLVRTQLMRQLEIENRYALQKLQMARDTELTLAAIDTRIQERRKQDELREAERAEAEKQTQHRLEVERRIGDFEREEEEKEVIAALGHLDRVQARKAQPHVRWVRCPCGAFTPHWGRLCCVCGKPVGFPDSPG